MNTLREAIRMTLNTDLSSRKIGGVTGLSHTTIAKYRDLLCQQDRNWEAIDQLNDSELENLLRSKRGRTVYKVMPDWAQIHRELQNPDVTLMLLWEDYRLSHPQNAYAYSQFTHYYRDYIGKIDRSMRMTHPAGKYVFVDFAGRALSYFDAQTDVAHSVPVFIGVMGCSNYCYVRAVSSQCTEAWIDAHNHMLDYFGGSPQIIVPDNLKAAVIRPGREPQLNRIYLEFARHYNVIILPARVKHPKDKAKAEYTVTLVYRWVYAKLRKRKFFSLEELNEAIARLVDQLNERPFKRLPGSRRSRFME